MGNIRHTVIVRKDLLLSEGLLAAQVAHINDLFMRTRILSDNARFTQMEMEWIKSPYLSVLAVNCKEDLEYVRVTAIQANLKVCEWFDTIPSPTFPERAINVSVGISIGPDDFDKIKIVTNSLKLY